MGIKFMELMEQIEAAEQLSKSRCTHHQRSAPVNQVFIRELNCLNYDILS